MTTRNITIHHSPDADDAFMFYGLTSGAIDIPGYTFSHELGDIQSLNERTLRGELEFTAVSVHVYPYLQNRYAILTCGASMGGADYGPRLIAKKAFDLKDGTPRTIALPGRYTSAHLAAKIYFREQGIEVECIDMDFDAVLPAVADGKIDGGIIIHEGQITHHKHDLVNVLDLGKWWWDAYGLPLPLGVNVARKDMGDAALRAAKQALFETIQYSLDHRDDAIAYALTYGRGISRDEADTFVGMYVNEKTLDLGEDGKRSIKLFLEKGVEHGFIPSEVQVEFV